MIPVRWQKHEVNAPDGATQEMYNCIGTDGRIAAQLTGMQTAAHLGWRAELTPPTQYLLGHYVSVESAKTAVETALANIEVERIKRMQEDARREAFQQRHGPANVAAQEPVIAAPDDAVMDSVMELREKLKAKKAQ